MQTPMFPQMQDELIARTRNEIIGLWPERSYFHGKHRANSLEKHLGVRVLSDCDDLSALEAYLAHVKGVAV